MGTGRRQFRWTCVGFLIAIGAAGFGCGKPPAVTIPCVKGPGDNSLPPADHAKAGGPPQTIDRTPDTAPYTEVKYSWYCIDGTFVQEDWSHDIQGQCWTKLQEYSHANPGCASTSVTTSTTP